MAIYASWRDVPPDAWRWRNFTPQELACRGTGTLRIDDASLDMLQRLRDRLGVPMIVTSGYRSPQHNAAVGGAPASQHLLGKAFDISMGNIDPREFELAARAVGFKGIGRYPRSNFIHVDNRDGPPADWGDPFPARATRFAEERPLAREHLAGSRTVAGGGVSGGGVAGIAGVEIVQDAVRETQGVLAGLTPYLDTARWLFLALAVAGIGVMLYARWDDWRRGVR